MDAQREAPSRADLLEIKDGQDTDWPSSQLADLKLEDDDASLQIYIEYGVWIDDRTRRDMETEKKLYPGSSTWAADEERLFEKLYLRQELPLLPSFWEIDFRGIPISEGCFGFGANDDAKPVIYAHRQEFAATMALMRLIDLTANVRTVIQCGLGHKAPGMIKKALEGYASWAAQDGGYAHLDVVPNVIVQVIDAREGEAGITRIIENRMRALARLQREYLKINRNAAYEDVPKTSWGLGGKLINVFFKFFEATIPHAQAQTPPPAQTENRDTTDANGVKEEKQEEQDTCMADIRPAPCSEYHRRPPVVYGLFIVKTSIFVMTVDSARGDEGYVSFHVDIDLKEDAQSVWNALTMAMVVCVARDDIMSRLEDFQASHTPDESDVDI